jgi:hypothetical protein
MAAALITALVVRKGAACRRIRPISVLLQQSLPNIGGKAAEVR